MSGSYTSTVDNLNSTWTYRDYLEVPDFDFEIPEIREAESYLTEVAIDRHQFFECAAKQPEYLQLWAEQELIVSSLFSQSLAEWIGRLDNCYVRRVVLSVLVGEHGEGSLGATGAHPVLAESMCVSLGTKLDRIVASPATVEFVAEMKTATRHVMFGAGFLGIGNERMLIPEYSAAMRCFEIILPKASYKPFLLANIHEDSLHSELIERATRGLVSLGYDPKGFLDGAWTGVNSRVRYFDKLLEICEKEATRQHFL